MDTPGDRRAFFKDLFGNVARGALEVAPSLGGLGGLDRLAAEPEDEFDDDPFYDRPAPASPSVSAVSIVDLLRLAEEHGLAFRAPQIQELARQSVRLTLARPEADIPAGGSRLGGAPDLPASIDWPTWRDEPLTFLAQLDLAVLAALGIGGALPATGLLLFFSKTADAPSGLRTAHRGSGRVIVVEGDPALLAASETAAGPVALGHGRAAQLSAELTLPRLWAEPVQALELDPDEETAWHDLRERLADLQGVELEDLSPSINAMHRLLGYPDETRGDMPLVCELTAAGLDAGDHPYAHRRVAEFEPLSTRWRLLLQLSIDDDLEWSWGQDLDRLYFWIDDADWQAGDMSRVWAVPE